MRNFPRKWTMLTPALALAAGGPAGAGEPPRALALSVVEREGNVELELIAQSAITQQVRYSLELIGSSTARHSGDTQVPAGERQVLSRLKSGVGDGWCATVHVTEGNGAHYTLKAGDCA